MIHAGGGSTLPRSFKGNEMAQKLINKEFDPLAGAVTEHYYDEENRKLITKIDVQMESAEKYAKAMRDLEGPAGQRFKGVEGMGKSIGVAPMSILWEHPEFMEGNGVGAENIRKWLRGHPKLKTTNARI